MRHRRGPVYRMRGLLLIPPVLFMLLCHTGELEAAAVTWTIGGALFLGGLLLRLWAQTHLHYRLRVRTLLTATGPYAHVRNPIYIANTILLLGLTVLSELIWFTPAMLAWCVVLYGLVVQDEELHLSAKHGPAYREYLRRVPRWIPRLRSAGPRRRMAPRHLGQSIVAELHCFVWLVPFMLKEFVQQ